MTYKILILFNLLFFSIAISATSSSNPNFDKGIQSFKQKNFSEALEHFKNVDLENKNNIANLFNIGLTELKLGHPGKAAAFWKKVIHLQPQHSQARKSLNSITKNLPNRNRHSNWEKIRYYVLTYFSLNQLMFFFTVFFAGTSIAIIKYFTKRHIAIKNHFSMPELPKLYIFFMIFFLVASFLFVCKLYDHNQPRATVVADLSNLYLSPSEEDIKINELDQGTEIIIKNIRDNWVHILTLTGNEGWVKSTELLQTSGSQRL